MDPNQELNRLRRVQGLLVEVMLDLTLCVQTLQDIASDIGKIAMPEQISLSIYNKRQILQDRTNILIADINKLAAGAAEDE